MKCVLSDSRMTIVATVCNIFTVTFYKEHAVQQHDLIAHSYFEKQILLGCHFPVNLRYLDASCDFPTKNKKSCLHDSIKRKYAKRFAALQSEKSFFNIQSTRVIRYQVF